MNHEVQENISIAPLTTIKIGGPARFFVRVTSVDDMRAGLIFANEYSVPFFVLAGGSNLLFSDDGFPGLILFIEEGDYRIDGSVVTAWSGVHVSTLVDATIALGLKGLEWAGGLPGSIGGAVRGNAGAFGGEIKDSVSSVSAVSINNDEKRIFSNKECGFSYRESFLKHHPEWFIGEITLQLKKDGDAQALRAEADDHIDYRKKNHPGEPNCGSMFKNIVLDKTIKLPDDLLSISSVTKYGKIGAGVLIDRCGLKGAHIGNAQISEKHANHIINLGKASATDVIFLLEDMERAVYRRYGINLEREVHVVAALNSKEKQTMLL